MSALATPNPDNRQEMWLAFTLIGGFARSGNEWVFLGALLILILYIIGRVVYSTSLYLIEVYSERFREQGEHVQVFRWALGIAAFFGLVGVTVMYSGERLAFWQGLALLANTFCLFSIFTVAYDWWLSRQAQASQPELEGVTVGDILKMKQTIKAARQGESQQEAS